MHEIQNMILLKLVVGFEIFWVVKSFGAWMGSIFLLWVFTTLLNLGVDGLDSQDIGNHFRLTCLVEQCQPENTLTTHVGNILSTSY